MKLLCPDCNSSALRVEAGAVYVDRFGEVKIEIHCDACEREGRITVRLHLCDVDWEVRT